MFDFRQSCPLCAAAVDHLHQHLLWHESCGHDMRQSTADDLKAEGERRRKADYEKELAEWKRAKAAASGDSPSAIPADGTS